MRRSSGFDISLRGLGNSGPVALSYGAGAAACPNGAHLVAKASSGEDSTTSVSKDWRGVSRKEINTTELATALGTTADDKTIRPFRVNIPEEQLVDLRRRIAATKWPERELVSDATQGVQLATMKKLADYWVNHNWRKTEANSIRIRSSLRTSTARHSLHSCPLEKPERPAGDHHSRLARFGH